MSLLPRQRMRDCVRVCWARPTARTVGSLPSMRGHATPYGLQRLLSWHRRNSVDIRDALQDYAAERRGEPGRVLLVDDTSPRKAPSQPGTSPYSGPLAYNDRRRRRGRWHRGRAWGGGTAGTGQHASHPPAGASRSPGRRPTRSHPPAISNTPKRRPGRHRQRRGRAETGADGGVGSASLDGRRTYAASLVTPRSAEPVNSPRHRSPALVSCSTCGRLASGVEPRLGVDAGLSQRPSGVCPRFLGAGGGCWWPFCCVRICRVTLPPSPKPADGDSSPLTCRRPNAGTSSPSPSPDGRTSGRRRAWPIPWRPTSIR